jgi:hypothetical protein
VARSQRSIFIHTLIDFFHHSITHTSTHRTQQHNNTMSAPIDKDNDNNKDTDATTMTALTRCTVCRTFTSMKCQRCKQACYCSKDCQRADWKQHKKICSANTRQDETLMGTQEAFEEWTKKFPAGLERLLNPKLEKGPCIMLTHRGECRTVHEIHSLRKQIEPSMMQFIVEKLNTRKPEELVFVLLRPDSSKADAPVRVLAWRGSRPREAQE